MGNAFSCLSGCFRPPVEEIEQFKKEQARLAKRRRFFGNRNRKNVHVQEESSVSNDF